MATVITSGTVYNKDKVNIISQQIIDIWMKQLTALQKPFKYTVTWIIMQKNGWGLQSAGFIKKRQLFGIKIRTV